MKPRKEKKDTEEAKRSVSSVQTPPPPQVIDPSVPPGQGRHETYGRGEERSEKREKKDGD